MSGGVLLSEPSAGMNASYLAELRLRPEYGPPAPNRPTPAQSPPAQPDTGNGTTVPPGAQGKPGAQALRDRDVFREAMGIAVQGLAFKEALPTALESPSRAIARKLPGSPENPSGVMKQVSADMEAWEERREADRKLMKQLDEMVYRS